MARSGLPLLTEAKLRITGEIDDWEAHEDDFEDVVEAAMTAAKNYIAAELGRRGIGPITVTVEI